MIRNRKGGLASPMFCFVLIGALIVQVRPTIGRPGDIINTVDSPNVGAPATEKRDIGDGDLSYASRTGALEYGYNFVVPPGRLGIQPAVGLSYSSQGSLRGGVAANWSMSLPMIQRDTSFGSLGKSLYSPSNGQLPFVSSMSGGHRLRPVSEPVDTANSWSAYRAEYDDQYIRYERSGITGSWRARTLDGRTWYFGIGHDGENDTEDTDAPQALIGDGVGGVAVDLNDRQPLTRMVDQFGNTIRYFWVADVSAESGLAESVRLSEIRYTENHAAGLGSHARVKFTYDAPVYCSAAPVPAGELPVGAALDYRGGTPWYTGRLPLVRVETFAKDTDVSDPWTAVRRVDLTLDDQCPTNGGGTRQLESIAVVNPTDGAPLAPPVMFGYGAVERSFDTSTPFTDYTHVGFPASDALSWGSTRGYDREGEPTLEKTLIDFDGDGRLDVLRSDPDGECNFYFHRNTGEEILATSVSIPFPDEGLHWADDKPGPGQGEGCSLSARRTKWSNVSSSCPASEAYGTYLTHRFIDMNADGYPDLVTAMRPDREFTMTTGGAEVPGISEILLESYPSHLSPYGVCKVLDNAEVESAIIAPCALGRNCECTYLDMSVLDPIIAAAEDEACGEFMDQAPPEWNSHGCGQSPRSLEINGHYPWKVYLNNKAGGLETTGTRIWSPVPLDPAGEESSLGSGNGTGLSSSNHAVLDITGDGIVDAIASGGYAATSNLAHHWNVFPGYINNGAFQGFSDLPFYWITPSGAKMGKGENESSSYVDGQVTVKTTQVKGTSQLVDLNGDGLPDLLRSKDGANGLEYALNMGSGFCADEVGDIASTILPDQNVISRSGYDQVETQCLSIAGPAGDTPMQGCTNSIAVTGVGQRLAGISDIDGDGLLDYYDAWDSPGGLHTRLPIGCVGGCTQVTMSGAGGGFRTDSSDIEEIGEHFARDITVDGTSGSWWWTTSDFMDLDGDGLDDLITSGAGNARTLLSEDTGLGHPLRLLNQVDNGQGLVTKVKYRPYNNDDVAIGSTQDGMPSHIWVVSDVTTESRLAAEYNPVPDSVVTLRYGDPVYNDDSYGRYGFRGFSSIETSSPHAVVSPSGYSITRQSYDYDVDWSGRLSETVVYTGGLAASIETTTWQKYSLFFEMTSSFHATAIEHRNCSDYVGVFQSYETCIAGAASSGETLQWSAELSSSGAGSNPALAYVLTQKDTYGPSGPGTVVKSAIQDPELHSDESKYWLANNSAHEITNVNGVIGTSSSQQWLTDVSNTYYESQGAQAEASGPYLSEVMTVDPDTGLVETRQDPEDVSRGLGQKVVFTPYTGFKIQPTTITNELGQVTTLKIDNGTGANLETHGPNPLDCDPSKQAGNRTEFDSLGRPTAVYEIGCYGGIYSNSRFLSSMQYVDFDAGTGVPAHVIATSYLDDGATPQTTVSTTYVDGAGRTIRTVVSDGTSEGIISDAVFDARGKLVRTIGPNPATGSGPGDRVDTSYDYDSLGRIIEVRQAPLVDLSAASGVDISYGFDGIRTSRKVEEQANDAGTNNPEATTTTYADFLGRMVQVDEALESGVAETFYEYDGNDNVKKIIDADSTIADSRFTEMEHDWLSRRTKVVRGQREWTYAYDRNGNMTFETGPSDTAETANNPGAGVYSTSTVFDALDRPTSRILATGGLTSAQLDDFDAHEVGFVYDTCTNGIGRLCTVTTGANLVTDYVFDYAGRVIEDHQSIELPESVLDLGDVGTDPDFSESRTTYMEYNLAGSPTDIWLADGDSQATSTHVSYTFDALGNPEVMTYHAPSGDVTTTVIRNKAQLVTEQVTGCLTRTWDYDHKARPTKTEVTGATCSTPTGIILSETMDYFDSSEVEGLSVYRAGLQQRDFTYAYDRQHQLVSAAEGLVGDYSARFEYSPAGLLETVGPHSGLLAGRKPMAYSYGNGQLAGADMHAPVDVTGDQLDLHYLHDFAGNVVSREEVDFSIDAQILADYGMVTFLNQTTLAELDDDVPLNAQAANNLMAYRAGADTILYTADDVDFQTVAEVDGVSQVGPVALGLLYDYSAAQGWVPEPFDTMGTFDGVVFTYQEALLSLDLVNTASAAELDDPAPGGVGLNSIAVNSIMNARPIADMQTLAGLYYVGTSAMGLIKDYASAQNAASATPTTWSFGYDGTNQQREVLLDSGAGPGSGGRELYYYDNAGARYMVATYAQAGDPVPSRIRIWIGGAEIWYTHDTFNNTMELQTEYAHLSLGGLSVGRVKTEGIVTTAEASFHNGLGHLMGAVDWDTGAVNAAFVYGPYGEVLESVGAETEDHLRRFNGKEADQLSKLSYYGFRYYDPLSLTWTQADPLYLFVPDLAFSEPRRMSLYSFSLNNPMRYMDPDGRDSKINSGDVVVLDTPPEDLDPSGCADVSGLPAGAVCQGTYKDKDGKTRVYATREKKDLESCDDPKLCTPEGTTDKTDLIDKGIWGWVLDKIGLGDKGFIKLRGSLDAKKAADGAMLLGSVVGPAFGAGLSATLARSTGDIFEDAVADTFMKKILRRNEVLTNSRGSVIGEIDFETADAIVEVGLSLAGKSKQLHRLADVAKDRGKRLDVIYGPATSPGTLRALKKTLGKKHGSRVRFIPHE